MIASGYYCWFWLCNFSFLCCSSLFDIIFLCCIFASSQSGTQTILLTSLFLITNKRSGSGKRRLSDNPMVADSIPVVSFLRHFDAFQSRFVTFLPIDIDTWKYLQNTPFFKTEGQEGPKDYLAIHLDIKALKNALPLAMNANLFQIMNANLSKSWM